MEQPQDQPQDTQTEQLNTITEKMTNEIEEVQLIDLEQITPILIDTFTNNIDAQYTIDNFKMKIDEDGITLIDQNGLIYELNELSTGQSSFFQNNKDKIVTIQQGIIKPEFEANQHNLIFTLYAKNIVLYGNENNTNNNNNMENDDQQNQESVHAKFKIFDMENNKRKQNIYEKAFAVKKALVRKHSQNNILLQGSQIWISYTQSYKQQQKEIEEEQIRLLKQEQQQNKKSHPKEKHQKEQIQPENQDEEDKKQQFKTPSKKTKTPNKVQNKPDENKTQSIKKQSKNIKEQVGVDDKDNLQQSQQQNQQQLKEQNDQAEEEEIEDGQGEGAVSVAKDKKAITKQNLIQSHRLNLQALYEADQGNQKVSSKKGSNKKKTVQIEDIEYEEDDSNEDIEADEEEEEEDIEEESQEQKQAINNNNKKSSQKQQQQQGQQQQQKQKDQQGFETDMVDEKEDMKNKSTSAIKIASVQKKKEIVSSLKKQSVDRMREIQKEREENNNNNEEVKDMNDKQTELQQKIAKLQKFVLKKEFLYYIGANDFQKKPEVRNAVLPRDPFDKTKMKQYSQTVVKYLESLYK